MISRRSTNVCLSVLTLFLSLVLCEGLFRAIGFDFAKQEQAWRDSPFYGQEPSPNRRASFYTSWPCHMDWSSLSLKVVRAKFPWDPYCSEPPVTAHYKRLGFRNP